MCPPLSTHRLMEVRRRFGWLHASDRWNRTETWYRTAPYGCRCPCPRCFQRKEIGQENRAPLGTHADARCRRSDRLHDAMQTAGLVASFAGWRESRTRVESSERDRARTFVAEGRDMQCVILAGGLGTRMRQLTGDRPKTLLPVGGFPFAFYQLDWLAQHGVTDVVYSIGFQGHLIQEYVGDGSRWGLRVRYVADGKELCGTAGALRRAFDADVLRDWFFVLYGDSFLPFDLRRLADAFLAQARPAMMTVYRNEGRFYSSNVHFVHGVVRIYWKGSSPN